MLQVMHKSFEEGAKMHLSLFFHYFCLDHLKVWNNGIDDIALVTYVMEQEVRYVSDVISQLHQVRL